MSPLAPSLFPSTFLSEKYHRYPIPVNDREIQGSCCAAEVVALGSAVTKFKPGDRVAPTVNLNFLTGEERDAEICALAGDTAGVFREWAVFQEGHLVALPAHLSWEEVRCPFPVQSPPRS